MSWLALAVRLGGFALLLPLVLVNFPDAEVSVWLLFSTVASLQVVADFGFGPTFAREIAYGFAGHSLVNQNRDIEDPLSVSPNSGAVSNWDTILAATMAMLWLYRRIAVVAFLLLAVLGTWAAKLPIERVSVPESAWLGWGAVVTTTAVAVYGNAYASFLVGANRIELQKRWEAVVSGISLLMQSVSVALGMGLLWIVLVAQVGLLAQVLVNRKLASIVADGRLGHAGQGDMNQRVVRSMWPAAWRTAVGTIMSIGVSRGIAIAMANLLLVSEAASVQLSLRVMQLISQFSQVPYYTCIPKLNRLRAGGQTRQLAVAAAAAMRNSLWIYVAGALCADLLGRRLLDLIGSQTRLPGEMFWLLLTLAFFAERYGAMHINLLLTSNRAIAHIANGVTGVIWIVGLLILFPSEGSLALPASMFIAYIGFYSWYSSVHSHRSMSGKSFWRFERDAALFPAVAVGAWTVYKLMEMS